MRNTDLAVRGRVLVGEVCEQGEGKTVQRLERSNCLSILIPHDLSFSNPDTSRDSFTLFSLARVFGPGPGTSPRSDARHLNESSFQGS